MTDVEIYDTTLRDGTQGAGISLSVADKLRIADRLDAFGVHYVEGGWPGSNPRDIEFFAEAKHKTFRHARLAAFGSTRRKDVSATADDQVQLLIAAGTPVVTIFGKTSPLHVREVLQTTLDENLKMIADTVRFLKAHGKFVVYDAEHCFDGFREDAPYALATLHAAEQAGADIVTLCDTNGGSLPGQVAETMRDLAEALTPSGVRVGIHTHDDVGCGVANTLAGVEAGATHVQGTMNGYGERCGNANPTTIIPNLQFKLGYDCLPADRLATLTETAHYLDELLNRTPNADQPYVGKNAFAHGGGMHADGVLKEPSSFEHMDPALVGNSREMLISELSGKGTVIARAEQVGLRLDDAAARQVIERVKELEHRGYQFEAADGSFELLLRKESGDYEPLFRLESWQVVVQKRAHDAKVTTDAAIRLWANGERYVCHAEGNGPVHALDNALRIALEQSHPELRDTGLVNFKVRILDETKGTEAVTRVLLDASDGHDVWGSIGVSENVIEASWDALVDSLEYAIQPGRERPGTRNPAQAAS
jgi:2-isopropylmalate synthase